MAGSEGSTGTSSGATKKAWLLTQAFRRDAVEALCCLKNGIMGSMNGIGIDPLRFHLQIETWGLPENVVYPATLSFL